MLIFLTVCLLVIFGNRQPNKIRWIENTHRKEEKILAL